MLDNRFTCLRVVPDGRDTPMNEIDAVSLTTVPDGLFYCFATD